MAPVSLIGFPPGQYEPDKGRDFRACRQGKPAVVVSARLTPQWPAPDEWGRFTILRAVRWQAISAFTASSACSRQSPFKGKPSRKAGRSAAISKTVHPTEPLLTAMGGARVGSCPMSKGIDPGVAAASGGFLEAHPACENLAIIF